MCNFLFNSFLSIHYNRCESKVSSSERPTSCLSRRKSSPALPFIHNNSEDFKEAVKKHSAYCVAATTDDIKQVKDFVVVEAVKETEEEEEEDYDMFDDLKTRCECGIELSKGWQCGDCRVSCPDCNRALAKDPQDYCTRCNVKCKEHGLYNAASYESCPQCEN